MAEKQPKKEKRDKKHAGEGSLKALVLAAGGYFILMAEQSFRSGETQSAALFAAAGVAAYLIHEGLSQYQFAYNDDLMEYIAQNTNIIDSAPDAADEGE